MGQAYRSRMPIVKCTPEDGKEAPFGVFIDGPITAGMEVRPGGGIYVVTAVKFSEDGPTTKVAEVVIRRLA
jgi:hypothetical protein